VESRRWRGWLWRRPRGAKLWWVRRKRRRRRWRGRLGQRPRRAKLWRVWQAVEGSAWAEGPGSRPVDQIRRKVYFPDTVRTYVLHLRPIACQTSCFIGSCRVTGVACEAEASRMCEIQCMDMTSHRATAQPHARPIPELKMSFFGYTAAYWASCGGLPVRGEEDGTREQQGRVHHHLQESTKTNHTPSKNSKYFIS
jgi:hypothetical protein